MSWLRGLFAGNIGQPASRGGGPGVDAARAPSARPAVGRWGASSARAPAPGSAAQSATEIASANRNRRPELPTRSGYSARLSARGLLRLQHRRPRLFEQGRTAAPAVGGTAAVDGAARTALAVDPGLRGR